MKARDELDEAEAAPGDAECNDGECGRFIGAVGAQELHVGAESRAIEQGRHGELADDDGKGQEGAREHGDEHVRQNDLGKDRRPSGAEALGGLGQGGDVDGAKARVDCAVHVG